MLHCDRICRDLAFPYLKMIFEITNRTSYNFNTTRIRGKDYGAQNTKINSMATKTTVGSVELCSLIDCCTVKNNQLLRRVTARQPGTVHRLSTTLTLWRSTYRKPGQFETLHRVTLIHTCMDVVHSILAYGCVSNYPSN